MKKIYILVLIIVIVGLGFIVMKKDIPSVVVEEQNEQVVQETQTVGGAPKAAVSQKKVYTNSAYAFSFVYPDNWIIGSGERKVIFTFNTKNGSLVEFMLDTFSPSNEPLFEGDAPVMIGTEVGSRFGIMHCGDGSSVGQPCVGSLSYKTKKMMESGFGFEFHFIGIPFAKRDMDVQDLFPEDVKKIEEVLASFKFLQ